MNFNAFILLDSATPVARHRADARQNRTEGSPDREARCEAEPPGTNAECVDSVVMKRRNVEMFACSQLITTETLLGDLA